jgi:hypothetical protein
MQEKDNVAKIEIYWEQEIVSVIAKRCFSTILVEKNSEEYKRYKKLKKDFVPSRDLELLDDCNCHTDILWQDVIHSNIAKTEITKVKEK